MVTTGSTASAAASADRLAGVAAAFGLGEVTAVERVARGAMGAVWQVQLDDHRRVAIKELFWESMSAAAAEDEVAFRELCAAAGVSSPRPLRTPAGALLVPGSLDAAWRAYEWIDGQVPDRSDALTAGWLASAMATMHQVDFVPQIAVDGRQILWYYRVDADWSGIIRQAVAAGLSAADTLRARIGDLVALSALVNAASFGEMRWCHRDLKNDNAILHAGEWSLIDWDNAGPMPPVRELGLLLLDHLADADADADVLRSIVDSYRQADGPARITGPDDLATGLAVWLNFLAIQLRVCLDEPPESEHREFAEKQVRGLIADLPTVSAIERAADTCRSA
ncbi:MAG: phosphotransferase enzyme family protein [Nakamurella sp.]